MSTVQNAGSGSDHERRRAERQSIIGRELISVEVPPDNFGLIIDLSEKGAAIQAVAHLFAGEHKVLRFTLPPDSEPLELKAEVIWSRQNKEAGLRFIDPPQDTRATIRRALAVFAKIDSSADTLASAEFDEFDPATVSWEGDEAAIATEPAIPFDLQLESLAHRAMHATQASGLAIAISTDGCFTCRASLGSAPEVGVVLQGKSGLSAEAIRTGDIVCCPDTALDSRVDPDLCRELGFGSAVIVPVRRDGETIALLECFWSGAFAYGDAELDELHRAAASLLALLNSQCCDSQLQPSYSPQLFPGSVHRSPARASAGQELEISLAEQDTTAVAVEVADYSAAEPDRFTKEDGSLDSPAAIELASSGGASEEIEPSTDALIASSSGQQFIAGALIAIAIFVLVTIPLTWYLWQRNLRQPAAPQVRSTTEPTANSESLEPDSVELPSLSTTAPPVNGAAQSAWRASSDARTRPVMVTTFTARPATSGKFQPLRLIDARRMPAGSIRVTGSAPRVSPSSTSSAVGSDSGSLSLRRGTVVLDVTVAKDGAVEEVRIVSGDPLLAEAAKAAVTHWRYQPATVDGAPVQGNARVTFRFQSAAGQNQ